MGVDGEVGASVAEGAGEDVETVVGEGGYGAGACVGVRGEADVNL